MCQVGVPTVGQGGRTDLLAVKEAIDEGASISDLYADHWITFARHERFVNNYFAFKTKPRTTAPVVLLFVGLSGHGKTRVCQSVCEYLGSYYKVPPSRASGMWFDEYRQETTCWIDDFDGSVCTPSFFKQLTDRYEIKVPVLQQKPVQFTSDYIIITSNVLPRDWWKKTNVVAITRRICIIGKFIPPRPPRRVVLNAQGQFIHL